MLSTDQHCDSTLQIRTVRTQSHHSSIATVLGNSVSPSRAGSSLSDRTVPNTSAKDVLNGAGIRLSHTHPKPLFGSIVHELVLPYRFFGLPIDDEAFLNRTPKGQFAKVLAFEQLRGCIRSSIAMATRDAVWEHAAIVVTRVYGGSGDDAGFESVCTIV